MNPEPMKLKTLLSTGLLLAYFTCFAQRIIPTTDSFTITGKIKSNKTFTLNDLDTFQKTSIDNQIIQNHRGEIKDTIKHLKGIPLKTIFSGLELIYDKPKELNEFYFVFKASDGYKVVFSWNEIYNTDSGNGFYVVTEMNDQKGKDLNQRILFISTNDINKGRRFIKGLSQIIVNRTEE